MNKISKSQIITFGVIVILIALFSHYISNYFPLMRLAPRGIHGDYSLIEYDKVYQTKISKEALLNNMKQEGLDVKSGRLNDYDPAWDSLRYLIGKIRCNTGSIEAWIEFHKKAPTRASSFKILWFNAQPNLSDDSTVYNDLARGYYDCFEAILRRYDVYKL